jgi:hypothetical protein
VPNARAAQHVLNRLQQSVRPRHVYGCTAHAESSRPRARRASRAAARRSLPNSSSSSARLASTPATSRPAAVELSMPSRRERKTTSRSRSSRNRCWCADSSHGVARQRLALRQRYRRRGRQASQTVQPITACQTARTLSPNLLSPNLCGAPDTVRGLPSGGCGDSSAERKFLSDKAYRRNDRGIVGLESLGSQGFGFFAFHACLDMTRLPRVQ